MIIPFLVIGLACLAVGVLVVGLGVFFPIGVALIVIAAVLFVLELAGHPPSTWRH